jgi:hypothetical protein
MAMIEKDTELPAMLNWKARALQGAGLLPFKLEGYDDFGNEVLRPAPEVVPEATAFCRQRSTKLWLRESAMDFEYFYNTFTEVILSRDRKQIVHLGHQEATDCRLGRMEDDGKIHHAYLNGDWRNYRERYTVQLPVIDHWTVDDVEALKARRDGFKFIYLSDFPTPGRHYYQMPQHEGFFTSGWYDVSQAIPEFKKFLMKNQMTLKYHVEIDNAYWGARYKGFSDMTVEKQQEIQEKELRTFNELLTGNEKAGRSLMTGMHWDSEAHDYRKYWKVTPLKGDDGDGKYNEDSREASMHKLRALGIDLAIFGAGPGRDNATAGSGSDKWAAMKMYLAGVLPLRDALLEPLEFAFDYNGWSAKGLVPRIVDHQFYMTATASELPSQNPNPARENK